MWVKVSTFGRRRSPRFRCSFLIPNFSLDGGQTPGLGLRPRLDYNGRDWFLLCKLLLLFRDLFLLLLLFFFLFLLFSFLFFLFFFEFLFFLQPFFLFFFVFVDPENC